MGIMSQEELDRYELFRRSKLSKAVLKRVRGRITYYAPARGLLGPIPGVVSHGGSPNY